MAHLSGDIPRLSFGLITDIHYADIPNGTNFHKTKTRYYRHGLLQLRAALSDWSRNGVSFVMQLGDLIDGQNNRTPGASNSALRTILEELNEGLGSGISTHHLVGNHDLYNFSRKELCTGPLNSSRLTDCIKGSDCKTSLHYHFKPSTELKIVVLDSYEISIHGYEKVSDEYNHAYGLLKKYNKNADHNDSRGLTYDRAMYVGYNGGMSERQISWLEETLATAEQNKENVIVVGHQGIHAGCSHRASRIWNCDEVLAAIQRHSDCVLAYICGHDHQGGYIYEKGVHYISLEAVVETHPDELAYATAYLYHDRLEICGSGNIPNYTLKFKMLK